MWFLGWAAVAWADPVVVARLDLYPGEQLEAENVVIVDVAPSASLPADALTTIDAAVGRIVRQRLLSGEVVRAGRLLDPAAPDPSQSTPLGARAFPVRWEGPTPHRGEEVVLVAGECRVGGAPVVGTAATARPPVVDLVVALPAADWIRAEAFRADGLKAVPAAGAPEAPCR